MLAIKGRLVLIAVVICCLFVSFCRGHMEVKFKERNNKNQTSTSHLSEKSKKRSVVTVNVTELKEDVYWTSYVSGIDNSLNKMNNGFSAWGSNYIGTVLGTVLEIEAPNDTVSKQAYGIIFSVYTNRSTPVNSIVTYTDYNTDYQDVVDLARGVFTVMAAGSYLMNFQSAITGNSTEGVEIVVQLRVNGIVRATSYYERSVERNYISISSILNLQRGDQVHVFVLSSASPLNTADNETFYTQFSGVKLG